VALNGGGEICGIRHVSSLTPQITPSGPNI
jgi:hypothetical protein